MRSLKICFVVDEFLPETSWGGIASTYSFLAKALCDLKNEVFIVTAGEEDDYTCKNNMHIFKIRAKNIGPTTFMPLKIISRFIFYVKICKMIKEIDLKHKLDVVQIPEARGIGAIYALFRDPKLITWISMPTAFVHRANNKNNCKSRIISRIYEFPEMLQTKNSASIISQTVFLKNMLSEKWHLDPERFKIIPNAVSVESIEKFSEGTNVLNEKDYLLYFGRFEAVKGVDVLVNALPGVFDAFPKQKFIFVGEDRGLKKDILGLKERYPENVIVKDRVDYKEIFPIIRDSRLVVLPSILENMATTCLESMALGKVVIATRDNGFEEVIEDGKSGYLVSPGSVDELTDKIIGCLGFTGLDEIGQNAKKIVETKFDIGEIAQQTLTFYEREIS